MIRIRNIYMDWNKERKKRKYYLFLKQEKKGRLMLSLLLENSRTVGYPQAQIGALDRVNSEIAISEISGKGTRR